MLKQKILTYGLTLTTVLSLILTAVILTCGPKESGAIDECSRLTSPSPPPKVVMSFFENQLIEMGAQRPGQSVRFQNQAVQSDSNQPWNKELSCQNQIAQSDTNLSSDVDSSQLSWQSFSIPLPATIGNIIAQEFEKCEQTSAKTTDLEGKISCYSNFFNLHSVTAEGVVAANRIGNMLRESGNYQQAIQWYERILPVAKEQSLDDLVHINLALAHMDMNDIEKAENLLNIVRSKDLSNDTDGFANGMYYVATGLLGSILEQSATTEQASKLYQHACDHGFQLMRDYSQFTWPAAYTAMAFVWRLKLLRKNSPEAFVSGVALYEDFKKWVPTNRWTWRQHHYLRDAIRKWRAFTAHNKAVDDSLTLSCPINTSPMTEKGKKAKINLLCQRK